MISKCYCPDCNFAPVIPYAHESFIGGGGWSIFRCPLCGCKFAHGSESGKWEIRTTIFSIMRRVFVPCKVKEYEMKQ